VHLLDALSQAASVREVIHSYQVRLAMSAINAVLTYQGYWDAYSSQSISRYAAELAYNITANGDASVSIGYERGTNKDTMTWLNQYVIRLNYKY